MRMSIRTKKVLLVILFLCVFVFVGSLAASLAQPMFSRAANLLTYLAAPPAEVETLDYPTLTADIRTQIITSLADKSFSSRIVLQRVEDWSPQDISEDQDILVVASQLSDTAPVLGTSWIGKGFISTSYGELLNELQRDAIAVRANTAVGAPERTIFETLGRRLFRAIGLGADSQDVAMAQRELEFALIPDPTRPGATHPRVALSPENIKKWLREDNFASVRKPISTVRLIHEKPSAIVPPDLAASGSAGHILSKNALTPLKGEVTATLYTRDWRLFTFVRPYKPERLLERHRSNMNPYIKTDRFFGAGGTLSLVPYGIIVAKDVVYEIGFTNVDDFRAISESIKAKLPISMVSGSSIIIVDAGAITISEGSKSIAIAPPSSRAQIVSVASLLY